jgi:hypothetical protein
VINSLKCEAVYLNKYIIYLDYVLSFTRKETKFSKIQSTGLEPVKFTWKAISLPLTYDCFSCNAAKNNINMKNTKINIKNIVQNKENNNVNI